MRKIMFIGRSEAGKTTLTQAMKGNTITYHKTLRDKGTIASLLDNIDGIGKVRKKELIKKYGSIKKMSEASIEELSEIIPENVAINLHKYLKERSENKNNASSL